MKSPTLAVGIFTLVFLLSASLAPAAATYYSDPDTGSESGDGTAKAPWPKLQDLAASGKLANLQGGDTLLLRSGNHGNVKISGDNAEPVTIAAEAGQTPQLSRFEITKGSKWVVKGLTISPSFGTETYKGNMVVLAEGGTGSEIVLEDCFLYSALDSSKFTAEEWMKAPSGIMSGRNGSKITLRNNYILNTRFAVSLCSPESLCEGNIITNFSGDGIRITRDSITVQYNTVKNGFVGPEDGDQNHDDLMQCFLFNAGTGTIRNEIVRGNILIGNEDLSTPLINNPQAIGFFDGPLVDFLIEKNVIVTNHYHGISLYDAVNCQILDNYVKAASDQKLKPWIMLNTKNKGGSSGNTVKNNMARTFNLKADSGVIEENNIPVNDSKFSQRLKELEDEINEKFGEFHPVAHLSRLGMRKGN